MEIYLRGATNIMASAIIIATSIKGCSSVLEAPPPKVKLTGASGPNINPQNQTTNAMKNELNRFYLHAAEIFTGSYGDISDRYMNC
jgi:predicted component of type VI protein secretion system